MATMATTADRARNYLEIKHGVDAWTLPDAEVVRRAVAILGSVTRLDDSEREYARDQAGRFASSGGAASAAAEHAEIARAAAAGTSSSSAKSRARKAEESAALARVAHEHGDSLAAAAYAGDAERHAAAAVKHGGVSEWTVRQRVGALREVDRAKATNDPVDMAKAHAEAARAFGLTSAAGREHAREAARHTSDAKAAEQGMRIGVSHIAGDDTPKPAPSISPSAPIPSAKERREIAERKGAEAAAARASAGDSERRAAENARQRARESVAKERKIESDRQITAQWVTSKVVSLPPIATVHLPSLTSRVLGRIFKRGDAADPVDRLRVFLAARGADVTRLDETEIVRRCSILLGPVEGVSTGARLLILARRASRL